MLWPIKQLSLGTAALLLPLTFSFAHIKIGNNIAMSNAKLFGFGSWQPTQTAQTAASLLHIYAQNPLPAQHQRRSALIIGNSNYQSADKLPNPVNDATDIANSLRQLGFEVTLLKDADLRQMEEALDNFNRQLRRGGVGLFYFSGHGLQVDGENYLIPITAKLEREQDVRYEAMAIGKVLNVMEDADNDANFIILDACRNNPFARQWRSLQRGLAAPIQAVKGTLIAYATAPGKVAFDGDGRNSPYTTALLSQMKIPRLDVEQMFKQVRSEVLKTTNGKQTPWESSSLVGSFAFNPTQDIASSVATTPSPQTPSPTSLQSTAPRTTYFVQQPRLVETTTSYNQAKALGAIYYFTIQVPEDAGTSLQQITINQREGAEYIRFHLKDSVAFQGTRSHKGEKIELKDVSSDKKNQTVSLTFDPPVSPGTKITIALKAVQNPQRNGVYLFGVTAFPMGDNTRGQFLGFGRLSFYQNI
ncbi:DUF2808 domain-containing protein [Nostoc sp. FACHB-110]|uniref:DUF2808 domain-containing protein n=1 Tax=Nostoc sp. FACHB-110 TaxID=2692834 RepID=UPI0028C507A9|nr:DUF2808 domain-containing protein [Nostoc sp. FACHB-110]